MIEKLFTLLPVLFCILCLEMTGKAWAGPVEQLEQAEAYQEQGQYTQAEQIYQQILTDYPGTDHAFQAQKNLTILYVTWDKQSNAEAALQQLLTDFSEHEAIAIAVTHVADTYRNLQKHQNACEIYNYVVNNWPDDEHGMWSQMGLVISNISLGNNEVAETAFDKLRTDYAGYQHLSRAVCLVADTYRKLEKHEKACERYQYALTNWPDAEFAIWSQMGLTISNIRLRNFDDADFTADKLCADFSEDKRVPIAVCMVADEYRKFKKYETARDHYQYVIDNWPDAEHALWSHMGLAISNIRLGDFNSAWAAVDKLFTDFFEDDRMAIVCCLVGDEYRKLDKNEKALVLYQYVVDNWPDAEHALWSQMGLAISYTVLQDSDAALAAYDELPANFSERPRYPLAVFQIGELYYRQALLREDEGQHIQATQYHQKAITEWEKIITELPESMTTAWAYNFAADCYRRLGQHQKAIEYYQTVVDDWPDYDFAWDALFRIGRNYEALDKSGLMSTAEANPKIRAVYEQVLEKYPDCKAAKYARRWLTRHHYR
ncbi:MAG: tetratricopeptide repeat protein [Aliifodinibius sp.]|nr:tetratricopeptide repeat protein [Fodinibius sp.]NIV13524.1 tetratricopeptide repeat protein [Fodinibius sp.]NIY27287.1 tetratricopeptide repeat protein [Fodinibius sp.]